MTNAVAYMYNALTFFLVHFAALCLPHRHSTLNSFNERTSRTVNMVTCQLPCGPDLLKTQAKFLFYYYRPFFIKIQLHWHNTAYLVLSDLDDRGGAEYCHTAKGCGLDGSTKLTHSKTKASGLKYLENISRL
jgi:hypothetical protein